MFTWDQIEDAAQQTIAKSFEMADKSAINNSGESDFGFSLMMGLNAGVTMQVFIGILRDMEENNE